MAEDTTNTILEGAVKFRDGKKWKARWAALRRLSPVADALELSLWSARPVPGSGSRVKAALELSGWLGAVTGFTLDRHSHTLALLCADCEAVLAFDCREQAMVWRARLEGLLGAARSHPVLTSKGEKATLLVTERRLALVSGMPPTVTGLWEIKHLRRFGVFSGRFVWEGGVLSGAGSGVHCAVSDDVTALARDVQRAAQGLLTPDTRRRIRTNTEGSCGSPTSSLGRSEAGSTLRRMPRCTSCSAALGGGDRSQGGSFGGSRAMFNPAWSMAPPARPPRPYHLPLTPGRFSRRDELCSAPATHYDNYDVPKVPSIEEGEYYDTPRRLRAALEGAMVRSMTCGGMGRWDYPLGLPGYPATPRRPTECPLYATVDMTLKARRRAADTLQHYENARFARSLLLYENARDLVSGGGLMRCASAEYLAMRPPRPPAPPAGYAPMQPAPPRARSDPLLLSESPPELELWGVGSHTGGNRDSSSSGDSGVGGCDPPRLPRRCRSVELLPPLPPARPSIVPPHDRSRSRAGDTSTSSGTSDLSDYMETLSLSSHSSADVARCYWRLQSLGTLRPRSGREYAPPLRPPDPSSRPPLPMRRGDGSHR